VDATTMSDKLKTLLKERLLSARAEAHARFMDFLAGRGTLDILLGASGRLRDAEFEMSAKQADQVEALEAHWKRMKMVEKTTKGWFDAGRIAIQDYEVSRYNRLNAEIALERAKTRPRP
jgi:hypothetical protein